MVENLKDQKRKMKKRNLHYDPVMEKASVS